MKRKFEKAVLGALFAVILMGGRVHADEESTPITARELRAALPIAMNLFYEKQGIWIKEKVTETRAAVIGDELEIKIFYRYGALKKATYFCHFHTPERFDCHPSMMDH